jgi:hypothetical protein
VSTRSPSAWGATRDALAAAHNLDALLRSGSVLYKTILDLLPELRAGAGVLLATFERAGGGAAVAEVAAYGVDRVRQLDALLDATALADEERYDLADRAKVLADELEATADLLALVERASDPVPTDVSVDVVVRETVRLSGGGRGREVVVRFGEAPAECAVAADPYLVGPLLAMVVSAVHAVGGAGVVVRARIAADLAIFGVEPAGPADEALPALAIRVLPTVPPTARAAEHVAARIGAYVELGPRRGSLRLPLATRW